MNDTTQDPLVGRRWSWFVAGGLLLAAAAVSAAVVHLYWLPCRGSILSGTWVGALIGGGDYSDACLRRMDDGTPLMFPDNAPPEGAELTLTAMVLAPLAWLVLVLGLRLKIGTKLLAMTAVVFPWAFTGFTVAAIEAGHGSSGWTEWLLFLVEPVAAAALVAVWSRGRAVGTGTALHLGLVLWGATAFGGWHLLFEFSFMATVNDANWDVPPGSGWLTVGVLAASGLCALTIGILGPRGSAPTKPSFRGPWKVSDEDSVAAASRSRHPG